MKKNTLKLVQLALLSGLIILLQLYVSIPLPGSLTLSLVLVPIVSAFTQKTRPAGIEEKFSCYDQTVVTKSKVSLG